MLTDPHAFDWPEDACTLAAGTQLQQRAQAVDQVLHIDSGRVALGVVENGALAHQMGVIEGPAWLNASCAVLGRAPVVDAIADTPVQVRRVPQKVFAASLGTLPAPALDLLRDMAQAHRQQAELAVSRLAKDAEARCAEWLLRHAEPAQDEPGALAVMLRQRKRMIAAQLGIAPETLSRVLRHLRERSLISGSGRVLNLVDLNGLRRLAGV
ncbi:Crp/Fnr family transcriptional regulator [Ottowia sp.]|uniref:Crp/Fnr family transcriptional regulator n=1 Tax=Ottowia sp. TaxID=1898956 RepID=UPI002C018E74|nr:Crp/Fnr family transcriptional regulator [Ottowia sp.]HOB66246.1 Crp/Fnr family transcriptional regulator [Ottowia sp.]HPZ58009.1 Crp/Fnr family transcriptional regulator [Ottowia sp.]